MGGYGSGRRKRRRHTTEERLQVDVRWLKRQGMLREGRDSTITWQRYGQQVGAAGIRMEQGAAVLHYTVQRGGGPRCPVLERVGLTSTPCHFGGSRPWFLCPDCGRRAAILYGGGDSDRFTCRVCGRLAYRSQCHNAGDRAVFRAKRIRARLGGDPGKVGGEWPAKPKGMHYRTYCRLTEQGRLLESWGLLQMTAQMVKPLGITVPDGLRQKPAGVGRC